MPTTPRRFGGSLAGSIALAIVIATLLPAVTGTPVSAADPSKVVVRAATRHATVNVRRLAASGVENQGRRPQLPRLRRDAAGPTRPDAGSRPPVATVTGGPRTRSAVRGARAVGAAALPSFAGLRDIDVCGGPACIEPPDPWVAVGTNHIVQNVNTSIRITNRTGGSVVTTTLHAFYGVGADQVREADSRTIFDPLHARWLGTQMSWSTCQGGHATGNVYLAVSRTSDPTGTWDIYLVPFVDELPDYPTLGTSTDKIVLSVNRFGLDCSSAADGDTPEFGGLNGASMHAVDWADAITSGASIAVADLAPADPVLFTWRPAVNRTSSATIYAITEIDVNTPGSYHVGYATVTGTISGGNIALSALADLTNSQGLAPFVVPPLPVQPGTPSVIDQAVDDRPTDALWQDDSLWFTSTYPCGFRDCVRVAELRTDVGPTPRQDFLVSLSGADAFMGGIGLATDGTLYVVYTGSSSSTYPSSYATFRSPGDPLNSVRPSIRLAAGARPYSGARWGDYVGVAFDPSDDHAVWQANQYAGSTGGWSTFVSQLSADLAPPTVTAPAGGFTTPSTGGTSTMPLQIAWTGSDAEGPVGSYLLQRSTDGGAFASVLTTTATSTILQVSSGHTYQFQVRAMDASGNTTWSGPGPKVRVLAYQETASATKYSGTWSSTSSSTYFGGKMKFASKVNASATFTFTGSGVAWLTALGPTRGSARIYVDGVLAGTVSTYRSTAASRQVKFVRTFGSIGTHTLKIVVAGTSGHPRVDVDAFLVSK